MYNGNSFHFYQWCIKQILLIYQWCTFLTRLKWWPFLLPLLWPGSDVATGEIELVFRPHPLEMNEDNELIRELKDSSIRYIKTTANATGTNIYCYLSPLCYTGLASTQGEVLAFPLSCKFINVKLFLCIILTTLCFRFRKCEIFWV